MEKNKIIKGIEEVCNEQIEQIQVYFKMLEEHECLNRINQREQFVMKMMPIVFKNKLIKKLKGEGK